MIQPKEVIIINNKLDPSIVGKRGTIEADKGTYFIVNIEGKGSRTVLQEQFSMYEPEMEESDGKR